VDADSGETASPTLLAIATATPPVAELSPPIPALPPPPAPALLAAVPQGAPAAPALRRWSSESEYDELSGADRLSDDDVRPTAADGVHRRKAAERKQRVSTLSGQLRGAVLLTVADVICANPIGAVHTPGLYGAYCTAQKEVRRGTGAIRPRYIRMDVGMPSATV
jgi:hypothetical protein